MAKCPNCRTELEVIEGKIQGHYVPPSLGDEGFFLCNKQLDMPEVTPLEIKMGINKEAKLVVIAFNTPVSMMNMTKEETLNFAGQIALLAAQI